MREEACLPVPWGSASPSFSQAPVKGSLAPGSAVPGEGAEHRPAAGALRYYCAGTRGLCAGRCGAVTVYLAPALPSVRTARSHLRRGSLWPSPSLFARCLVQGFPYPPGVSPPPGVSRSPPVSPSGNSLPSLHEATLKVSPLILSASCPQPNEPFLCWGVPLHHCPSPGWLLLPPTWGDTVEDWGGGGGGLCVYVVRLILCNCRPPPPLSPPLQEPVQGLFGGGTGLSPFPGQGGGARVRPRGDLRAAGAPARCGGTSGGNRAPKSRIARNGAARPEEGGGDYLHCQPLRLTKKSCE